MNVLLMCLCECFSKVYLLLCHKIFLTNFQIEFSIQLSSFCIYYNKSGLQTTENHFDTYYRSIWRYLACVYPSGEKAWFYVCMYCNFRKSLPILNQFQKFQSWYHINRKSVFIFKSLMWYFIKVKVDFCKIDA